MKIVYVNTPMQDEHTENPQVIDGYAPNWCVITMAAKENQTLKEFFEDRWNYIKSQPSGKDIIGFYLYDVSSVGGIMDENRDITSRSALFVRFDYMKEIKKEDKPLFHFVHVTDEDQKRENEKIISELTEDKKSEFSFQGNYFYELGRGHAYLFGFFTSYITKVGIKARRYDSGKWSIGNEEYNYEDGEFIIIPKPTVNNKPTDWSGVTFPKLKNLSGSMAHKIPSVKPKER